VWKKVAAYAIFAAMAAAMIWYVDLEAHQPKAVEEPRSGGRK
jgi:hypothetical protein